jgi:hypothetical protein
LKKPPQKVAYLWQLGVFFSAAPTAQNSPEIHFRFINSFIQSSLLRSLAATRLVVVDIKTFFKVAIVVTLEVAMCQIFYCQPWIGFLKK